MTGDEISRFHTIAAKLLYLAKRTRGDILTPVSVICSRVEEPSQNDLVKLLKIIKYILGTIGYGLKFEKKSPTGSLSLYYDVSFETDIKFKSRTGIIVMYGDAPVVCKSNAQHIVTKSSAEAELVALCDGVSVLIGCRNFLTHLDVELTPSVVYEDNKAVLEMVKSDGPFSLRTRHMGIKLFFTKQYVDNGDIVIKYCPTDSMLADMMTKALTGIKFRNMRDLLLHSGPD